jgi:hypothetical protein
MFLPQYERSNFTPNKIISKIIFLHNLVSRISRKDRIRNVTIKQQIGLEETIIKEIEQNRLTWYGHVQRMAEGRLPKIALKWMPKQREHEEDRRKTGWKE